VVSGGGRFAKAVTQKVIDASQADGARESGLTALIWNQVLSYGTDAMITVALAGTVFFGASAHAQRGNVLLYLLVTMAPFAVVAPVIGPALDRLQHGRRLAMSATGIGRAILSMVMAAHPTDLLVLYPCALGSLVFSKAFSVVRASAAPRLVPPGMTLVEANARLSIFGLGSALVGGGLVAGVIKATGSYSVGLWVTALAFVACAMVSITLPKQVDSTNAAVRNRERASAAAVPVPDAAAKPVRLGRVYSWARRGFEPQVITALQGESALRFLSGFLTIFLAFYIEATAHGFAAAGQLGAVGVAAGAGNFVGTGVGARLKLGRPEILIMICLAIAAVATVIAAIFFSVELAIAAMFLSAVTNSLAKVALDAVIQRDVVETLRSSAFGRSETFLQLAWVLGAAIACLLPGKNGALGFWLSGVFVAVLAVVVALRNRALRHELKLREARTAAVPRYLPDQPHA
jgi:MFS family permease